MTDNPQPAGTGSPQPAGTGSPPPAGPGSPPPAGPYSPIVRAGDWLVTAGQLGVVDGELADGIEAQTAQCMANLRTLLEGEGSSMDAIVKTTIFLADIADWPAMNGPYLAALGDNRPARSAFAVGALPRGALVEIEAWAFVGTSADEEG